MDQLEKLLSSEVIADVNISLSTTILAMLSAAVCAAIIKHFYAKYGLAMNNREYFGQSFVLLAITTVGVITIVKYSLALSLGLVGALSIVRFRAAIKEPEELTYLFLIIAVGLAFGSNQFAVGFCVTAASLFAIYVYSKIYRRNSEHYNANLIVIISGRREAVIEFYHENEKLISAGSVYPREVSFDQEIGRIVLETGLSLHDLEMKDLETRVLMANLNLEFMTGVMVPN